MAVASRGELIVGRYLIVEAIGQGAHAHVFRAHDTTLARDVAIKFLLRPDPREAEAERERFLREARLAAAVDHPNVVRTIDFGAHEGVAFMVMELLEGESLDARLDRDPPLRVGELIDLVTQVLAGLAAAHDAGIVHRDVKPQNIVLVPRPDGLRPKLVDFGVSQATGLGGRRSALTTSEGLVVGTPEYMSPEQARGMARIDRRSDLYSVGVILYEALTGYLPFDADSMGDLLVQITAGGARPVRERAPGVSAALAAVIERAMSLDPADRPADAAEMARALLRAVGAAPTSPQVAELVQSAPPSSARHRAPHGPGAATLQQGVAAGREPELPAPADALAPGRPAHLTLDGDALAEVAPEAAPPASPASPASRAPGPPAPDPQRPPIASVQSQLGAVQGPGSIELAVEPASPRTAGTGVASTGGVPGPARVGLVERGAPARRRSGGGLAWMWLPLTALVLAGIALTLTEQGRGVTDAALEKVAESAPELLEAVPIQSHIRVVIQGVPPDAKMRLDGSPWVETDFELQRDGAIHLIEVTAPHHEPWSATFEATRDQELYVILLRP
ncbi:MAG: protein kinase [Myxococcales bacterium]|jgi:serine/threonine-protein kinase